MMPSSPTPRLASLLVCAIVSLPGQEPAPARAQPRDLVFGTLAENACVQASFQVFWQDAALAGQEPVITTPPFVEVRRSVQLAHPQHGARTQVFLAIATGTIGELEGDIEVTCGAKSVRVPVEAVVLPRANMTGRVLVLTTPFVLDSAEDSTAFAAWRRIVAAAKLEVQYPEAPPSGPELSVELLRRADVALVAEEGLIRMTALDARLLQGFVCGGGRLIVFASAFFVGTVAKANDLLEPFGLRMDDVEPPATVGRFQIGPEDIEKDPLTAKVGSLEVHRPSPIVITDDKRARPLVRLHGFPDGMFAAVSRCESGGEVVAIGSPIWWSWVGRSAENEQLLRNLLTRPSRERR